jgi:DNA polymerase-3 subunit chi
MEVWFYHLTRQPLDRALPTLLERSIERGWRAVVQASSPERVGALDEWLWTYSEEAFLPHGLERDGDADMQPVYLTTGPENPNGARVRFFIERARVAPVIASDAAYDRALLMFDGNDEDELRDAREQWVELKAAGADLAYWRQNENGGWEKVAL